MSKPLCWFLELLGLFLIMMGWGSQDWTWMGIGIFVALIGAVGIRNRMKADKK